MERAELMTALHATGCATERGGFVFMCDPSSEAARGDCHTLYDNAVSTGDLEDGADEGWLCIATGGSGGRVKWARHDERTLGAAVRGFCEFFGMARVNAVDVLPAFHVSGLMARVRCAATGGEHRAWDWKRLEAGDRPELPVRADGWVISLVPTQLQRLVASTEATAWLRRFRTIFVGGGPMWAGLAESAAAAELRLSPGYGMTETAAMVAALKPEEFLAGGRNSGRTMPHARLSVDAGGVIAIKGASVFRGYFPATSTARVFATEDLGRIDGHGFLHVLGRRDAVIITGGKKVQPADVEAALRATGEFVDVAVVGVADAEWGEAVVACYPAESKPNFEAVTDALEESLPAFQRPKRFVAIADWPRTAQGKVNRVELIRRVRS
ncbi:MAG TPA: AMP-binding protein [Opitutus sp.]|nr:AMP-binding protein [Opitutus sp.]